MVRACCCKRLYLLLTFIFLLDCQPRDGAGRSHKDGKAPSAGTPLVQDVGKADSVRVQIAWSYHGLNSRMQIYEPAAQQPLDLWETASVKDINVAPVVRPISNSVFWLSPGGKKFFVLGMHNKSAASVYFFASPHRVEPVEHTLGFKFKCLCINHAFSIQPRQFWYRVVKLSLAEEFRGDRIEITHDLIGIDEARKRAFESNQQKSRHDQPGGAHDNI